MLVSLSTFFKKQIHILNPFVSLHLFKNITIHLCLIQKSRSTNGSMVGGGRC
ncbi:hypothetical protein HanRHA438_Chr11g0488681 [Helianthus annuus]|nr:hypothetical protein HanRHA438_Chr11g0488681 [Helianthus annuus]